MVSPEALMPIMGTWMVRPSASTSRVTGSTDTVRTSPPRFRTTATGR